MSSAQSVSAAKEIAGTSSSSQAPQSATSTAAATSHGSAAASSAPASGAMASASPGVSHGSAGAGNGTAGASDDDCIPASLAETADEICFDQPGCFIPITRYALMDRLTRRYAWPGNQADEARRFFRYLDFWRQQSYAARMLEIEQNYEPFSPDSDLLITRQFRDDELVKMRGNLVGLIRTLLEQANFIRIDPAQVDVILSADSAYGLDLTVDLEAFEECLMYFRGASLATHTKRDPKKLLLKKIEFKVPIFQRLFILFKLKPEAVRLAEIKAKENCDDKTAQKILKKAAASIPPQVSRDYVYMKMFKDIPRSDMEMCFPNTKIKFRKGDKLKLGVTAGGGFGMGLITTVGKLAAATTPVGMAAATLGLGGVAARQVTSFMGTRQKYMVKMAQNLYFHSMADNRGVITLMADRAVEEDIKEEMLLYGVLAKEHVHFDELPDVKLAIEQYLYNGFGIEVHFDVHDALERLMADGIVSKGAGGMLTTLLPHDAALHIDKMWDSYLDELPDPARGEGEEV